jgi:hypothetical protein
MKGITGNYAGREPWNRPLKGKEEGAAAGAALLTWWLTAAGLYSPVQVFVTAWV